MFDYRDRDQLHGRAWLRDQVKQSRFVIEGVAFECLGRWRYVVVYRYPGASRAHIAPWEGFTSFGTMPAASRAFIVTRDRHVRAYVYLADLKTNTFVRIFEPERYDADRVGHDERPAR